jgi:hypothetical protein
MGGGLMTVTIQDVNKAIRALERLSRPQAQDVLRKFSVDRTPDLRPEHYQEVIDLARQEIERLGAGFVRPV